MSSGPGKRAESVEALMRELRHFSDQDVLFNQALAERMGLNLTDLTCLSILERSGSATAGRLAEMTGLTSGAVTGLIDRLEKAGWVRRVRNPNDRRHVIIEWIPERAVDFDKALVTAERETVELVESYTEEQRELLQDFLVRAGGVLRDEASRLRSEAGARTAGSSGEFSGALGTLKSARLRFTSGVSRATIRTDAPASQLYVARFEGRAPTVREEAGIVTIQYPRFSLLDWRKLGAEVSLNNAIPWQIELKGGASRVEADLSALVLQSLELLGGASEITMTLPKPTGTVPLRVSGGASRITFYLPPGVPARLQVKGGVNKLAFEAHRLGSVGGQMSLESPDFKNAEDRYDIEVTGGAEQVSFTAR